MSPQEKHSANPNVSEKAKKPYNTPNLVEYGTITKLTQSVNPGGAGDNPGMRSVVCL